jgi:hypothetical protein
MNQDIPKFREYFYAEQSPEKILFALESAAEKETWAELTVLDPDGITSRIQRVLPCAFEDGMVWIQDQNGQGIAIELSRIKMVQLPETEQPEVKQEKTAG